MARIPVVLQRILGCFMVFVGVFIGIAGLLFARWLLEVGFGSWRTFLTALVVIVPLFSSFVAIRNQKRAAFLLLVFGPIVGFCAVAALWLSLWFAHDAVFSDFLFSLIPVLVVPVGLGLFWYATHTLGWLPLVARPHRVSIRRRIIEISTYSLLAILTLSSVTVALAMRQENPGECNVTPPFATQKSSNQVVAMAKVIQLGPSAIISGHRVSPGAIAIVQRRFWGLSAWNPGFVILVHGAFENGESYFVDGVRADFIVARLIPFLPIVEAPRVCSRTALVEDAGADLRLLRDRHSKDGVRIIGRVVRELPDQLRIEPVRGVDMTLTGPTGTTVATTDVDGIYDVSGLEPGRYVVAPSSDLRKQGVYSSCERQPIRDLKVGDVWGCTVFIHSY